MLNTLADVGGSFWMPPSASTIAPDVDRLFYFIFFICLFFFALILVLLVLFAWKYRARPGFDPGEAPKHNTALELTWTFVPTMIVVVIFFFGFKGYMAMAIPPKDPYQIVVNAHMWGYAFTYPDQHSDATVVHIPTDTPVQFLLSSNDVIHGFYIPAFRIKKDDVPGRTNSIWINANVPGTYDIYCTQYCGQGHSTMRGQVIALSPEEFKAWMLHAEEEDIHEMTPVKRGEKIYQMYCISCHSVDGSIIRAPSWKNLYLNSVHLADGETKVADAAYLHKAITQPNSMPLPDFSPTMINTSFLTEADVQNVIAYIESLSNKLPADIKATTQPVIAHTGEHGFGPRATPETKPATLPSH